MKIVVIGGTGLIGPKLVEKLRRDGHDALTADGLPGALEGARVVVDVSDFSETSSSNLLAAETAAGVGHHVMLSIVGADRFPESAYLRSKVAQEEAVKAGPLPYTILRTTQLFELVGRFADASSESVRRASVLVQPVAADDVTGTLADLALGSPLNDTVELAGQETFRLAEHARYFGAELRGRSLAPADDARIATTRFEDWLRQSPKSHHERRAA
jgi:uncharacterized protein YbjT (DUF2867 family)